MNYKKRLYWDFFAGPFAQCKQIFSWARVSSLCILNWWKYETTIHALLTACLEESSIPSPAWEFWWCDCRRWDRTISCNMFKITTVKASSSIWLDLTSPLTTYACSPLLIFSYSFLFYVKNSGHRFLISRICLSEEFRTNEPHAVTCCLGVCCILCLVLQYLLDSTHLQCVSRDLSYSVLLSHSGSWRRKHGIFLHQSWCSLIQSESE